MDQLTDAAQADFDLAQLLKERTAIVLTPEKLLYVLKQEPELAGKIGLVVFDEGHQFDSGQRGITYPRKRRQTRRPFAKTQHCE